ncbi:MAG: 4'-phosphopantetheinyl transferase superfamily protein [Clostridia bacterium]
MRLLAVNVEGAEIAELTSFLPLLTQEKRERCLKFQQKIDRCRAIVGHLLLSYGLAANACLELELGEFGKPYLRAFPMQKFNLAHAGAWVFLGLSCEDIGVDIIKVEKTNLALAARFFASEEYQQLVDLPEKEQDRGFAALWALKESYIKALGIGLSCKLNSFVVSLGEPPRILVGADKNFKLALLEIAPTYLGAVCCGEIPLAYQVERVELAELIAHGRTVLEGL